jgi:hypothetical protein
MNLEYKSKKKILWFLIFIVAIGMVLYLYTSMKLILTG